MNRDHDDERTARSQVTLRLDRDLLERIDNLAGESGVDRTDLVRRLLTDGLAQRRIELALDDYAAGRRSAWSAAQMAEVGLYEMLDRIAEAGIAYRVDPDALDRLRGTTTPPPSGAPPERLSRPGKNPRAESDIDALRDRYRPVTTRILFVGESSPAGGTHFYRSDSILYRATRESFGAALSVAPPPEGEAFLSWFQSLGCWLLDLAAEPANRLPEDDRVRAVDVGVPALMEAIRDLRPERIVVVLRRVAPATRRAASLAGFDDRAIDVLPFPTRQWRPVFVDQLAGILRDVLGSGSMLDDSGASSRRSVVAERPARYGPGRLHDVIADVLRRHGNGWMRASAIARAIAAEDLWRRPSDGRHPPPSQISARVRSSSYASLFQTSDLGIRLRDS